MAERTLFSAQYTNSGGRIVRTNLKTNQTTDLYNQGIFIQDMAILNENLLFVESNNGIKTVPKDSNGYTAAHQVNTTGLDVCNKYYSIHVAKGEQ